MVAGVLLSTAFLVGFPFASDPKEYSDADWSQERLKAMKGVPSNQQAGMKFLLDNLPPFDRDKVKAEMLIANTKLAYRAVSEVPWGKKLPEDVFLNAVLPYANLDETREDWRTDLYNRYIGLAKSCKTPGEAALKLNEKLFPDLNVKYHATKRRKPNQSPSESIKLGYASCTGLSILLVDACRAVGVPARIAGTAMWFDNSGNHTWVEVWDNGEWKYIGAAEPGPFNQTWFSEKASKADASDPRHAIYAVSYKRTGEAFVLSWNPGLKDIHATNVTYRYRGEKETLLAIQPAPTESKLLEGTLVLGARSLAWVDQKAEKAYKEWLPKLEAASGIKGLLKSGRRGDVAARIKVEPGRSDLGSEGYAMTITPDLATLVAPSEAGIKRALEAFLQLVPKNTKELGVARLPCVNVRDVR